MAETTRTLHASAVAFRGRAVLILGPSGSGKSGLALQLMGLGATLVADDRTILTHSPDTGALMAQAPATLAGRIEARFVGILRAPRLPRAPVALAVDMARAEAQRLPPRREARFLECTVPLLHRVDQPYFASAILHHLTFGRSD